MRRQGETAQECVPALQSSKGERLNIQGGASAATPPRRMEHSSRAAIRKEGLPFSAEADCYPTLPRTMLPSRFCHMVDDHSQKKLHPLSPAPSIVSLQKADRGEPERGSHARFPMVALLWLGCLTLSVWVYAHTYSYIALYLYSLITLLLYSLIVVFMYCYIYILGYCRIRVFYYCSSYLLLAIRQ